MGSCQDSNVIEVKRQGKIKNGDNLTPAEVKSLEAQIRQEFPDFPEWEGNRYTGVGIKRMKGYICDLKIDKLNEKRNEFWSSKNKEDHLTRKIWRVINQACVYDECNKNIFYFLDRANLLLEEFKLCTAEGCINHLIDADGTHYFIPNYCINDPYFEKTFENQDDIKEKKIKITLFEISKNVSIDVEISNQMKGEELKELFRKKAKFPEGQYTFRIFFSGSEIKNDQTIGQHKLQDGFKLQVIKFGKSSNDPKTNKTGGDEEDKKEKKKKKKKKTEENNNEDNNPNNADE
ncbi:MAG: hypothetical protein MJ252_12465 [archaeon]|nr:hypothetical protein [archaeon]